MDNDVLRESIEKGLIAEVGFEWTPQMRHGHKALKLWNKIIDDRLARATINSTAIDKLEIIFDTIDEFHSHFCFHIHTENLKQTIRDRLDGKEVKIVHRSKKDLKAIREI